MRRRALVGNRRRPGRLTAALAVSACLVAYGCDDDETEGGGSTDGQGASGAGGSQACAEGQLPCQAGCCDCPVPGEVTSLALAGPVSDARGGDIDGDGSLEVVVTWSAGGVTVLKPNACGWFEPTAELTIAPSGIDLGLFDAAPGVELVVMGPDFTLSAYAGTTLQPLWSDTVVGLSSAGAALAAHLDSDGDHDIAAFDSNNANLLRVENTGAGWNVKVQVQLPAGIARVAVGDLGGGPRDELLFLGGGLVQVVSVADFDFSDIRFLSNAAHGYATFGDFNGDGYADAAISAGASVELWSGNGNTVLTLASSSALAAPVIGLATYERDGAAPAEVVALMAGGGLQVLSGATLQPGEQSAAGADATHVMTGDVDADGRQDVVAVGDTGRLYVWRTP